MNTKNQIDYIHSAQKMTKIMEDCQADTIAKDSSAEEQTANLQLNPLPPLNIQPSSPRPILPTSPFSASSTSSEDWFDFQDHKTDVGFDFFWLFFLNEKLIVIIN